MKKGKLKDCLLDILFPKFCFFCHREGSYLCEDCLSLFDVSGIHHKFKGKYIDDLYFALDYQNIFFQNTIRLFKYPPLIKDLAEDLTNLILYHFSLLEEKFNFSNYLVIPVPLSKKKVRWRGFNQSEEIAKRVADFFHLSLISNCLIKTRETKDQVFLSEKERKENVKGVFAIKEKEKIQEKNIILVDDVFTTGATMEECARLLKENGAKRVIGIVLARAVPGIDRLN